MQILRDLKKMYGGFNTVTKYTMRYGTVLILTLTVCAVFYYIRSFSGSDMFFCTAMYNDIMYCIKECMGSIYVLPMLFETLLIIAKSE